MHGGADTDAEYSYAEQEEEGDEGGQDDANTAVHATWFAPLNPFDVFLAPPWLTLTDDLLIEMEDVIAIDFGDGGTVKVELGIAEILGAVLRKMLTMEEKLTSYSVQNEALTNNTGREAYEQWVSAISEGRPVKVTHENLETNVLLAIEFQNRDFFRAIWADGVVSDLSGDHLFLFQKHRELISAFMEMIHLEWTGLLPDQQLVRLWDFDIEVLKRAGVDTLTKLLKGSSCDQANEGCLCHTLVRLCEEDGSNVPLLQYLFYTALDLGTLFNALSVLGDNCGYLPGPLVEKLLRGCANWPGRNVKSVQYSERVLNRWRKNFPFIPSGPGSPGIIHHLSQECEGNVHDMKAVFCSSSTAFPGSPAKYAAQRAEKFCSYPSKNAWLQYDFLNKSVHPTAYYLDAKDLTDWVFEGRRNAKSKWEVIDERRQQTAFNNRGECCYGCSIDDRKSYRYLRLRQTTRSKGNTAHHLEVWYFEIYGILE